MSTPAEILARLREGVLLADGGLGSLLIAMGLDQGRAPDWWNLDHPDRIIAAHRAYVEAGCDIIHANTFGSTPPKLAVVGLKGRCAEVNAAAVAHARAACEGAGRPVLVAGDIGPTGVFLPPMGAATEDDLAAAFAEQAGALAESGVDLLSIETMYDLREARAAVRAAHAIGLPVLASMTFERRPRGFFTIMGDRLVPSLLALHEDGAHVVGFNCSVGSADMVDMVAAAAAEVDVPLMAQPNAGQPQATPDGVVYDAAPDEFVADLMRIVDAGARIVGGCCGSDPGFLRKARGALDARVR